MMQDRTREGNDLRLPPAQPLPYPRAVAETLASGVNLTREPASFGLAGSRGSISSRELRRCPAHWARTRCGTGIAFRTPCLLPDGPGEVPRHRTAHLAADVKAGPTPAAVSAGQTPTLRSRGTGPLIFAMQSLRLALDDLVEAAFTLRRVTP